MKGFPLRDFPKRLEAVTEPQCLWNGWPPELPLEHILHVHCWKIMYVFCFLFFLTKDLNSLNRLIFISLQIA